MDQVAPEIDVGRPHGGGHGNQHHRKAIDKAAWCRLCCGLAPGRGNGHRHYSFGRRGSDRAHRVRSESLLSSRLYGRPRSGLTPSPGHAS